jgi:hypothetical protein
MLRRRILKEARLKPAARTAVIVDHERAMGISDLETGEITAVFGDQHPRAPREQ